jgi:hypothetical protein
MDGSHHCSEKPIRVSPSSAEQRPPSLVAGWLRQFQELLQGILHAMENRFPADNV